MFCNMRATLLNSCSDQNHSSSIPGSEWAGRCGAPGIGTSLNNVGNKPSALWEDRQEAVEETNLKARLLKFFKSTKLMKKSKSSDSIKQTSPFTFPRLKLRKDDDRSVSTNLTNSAKCSLYPSQNPNNIKSRESINRAESMPSTGKRDVLAMQVIPSMLFMITYSDTCSQSAGQTNSVATKTEQSWGKVRERMGT